MTIYTVMNNVYTLRTTVTFAVRTYKANKPYYSDYEEEARISLSTLCDVGYIS